MKTRDKLNEYKTVHLLFAVFAIGLYFSCTVTASDGIQKSKTFKSESDTTVSVEIKAQLTRQKSEVALYYPNSVARFYSLNKFQPVWVNIQKNPKQTWEAMLMLDCVLQFGLSHIDYHPKELGYDRLHTILEQPDKVTANDKAAFDIVLTDALIALMNNLHYGKLNPEFPAGKIDAGIPGGFNADDALVNAMAQKDLMTAVLAVQPKLKAYANLQYHMHLLQGVYQGDCYDIPEAVIRKMAINMERLRWASIDDSSYIHINIPSYTLKFHQPDTTYEFRIMVGKPAWPTPSLHSAINYFTTSPDWKVPKRIFIKEILPKAMKDPAYLVNNQFVIYDNKGNYVNANPAQLARIKQNPGNYYARQSSGCDNSLGLVVFRFPNIYDVYLHDTPEQQLFSKDERDFSHGCIRVEQAEKLAGLLLKYDGAENLIPKVHKAIVAYKTRNFNLKKAVPIRITYLTCEMHEGTLITYKDVYNLDSQLESALYNVTNPLIMN